MFSYYRDLSIPKDKRILNQYINIDNGIDLSNIDSIEPVRETSELYLFDIESNMKYSVHSLYDQISKLSAISNSLSYLRKTFTSSALQELDNINAEIDAIDYLIEKGLLSNNIVFDSFLSSQVNPIPKDINYDYKTGLSLSGKECKLDISSKVSVSKDIIDNELIKDINLLGQELDIDSKLLLNKDKSSLVIKYHRDIQEYKKNYFDIELHVFLKGKQFFNNISIDFTNNSEYEVIDIKKKIGVNTFSFIESATQDKQNKNINLRFPTEKCSELVITLRNKTAIVKELVTTKTQKQDLMTERMNLNSFGKNFTRVKEFVFAIDFLSCSLINNKSNSYISSRLDVENFNSCYLIQESQGKIDNYLIGLDRRGNLIYKSPMLAVNRESNIVSEVLYFNNGITHLSFVPSISSISLYENETIIDFELSINKVDWYDPLSFELEVTIDNNEYNIIYLRSSRRAVDSYFLAEYNIDFNFKQYLSRDKKLFMNSDFSITYTGSDIKTIWLQTILRTYLNVNPEISKSTLFACQV